MSKIVEKNDKLWLLVFSMWCIAVIGTLGSLFFSEFMEFIPCTLCWYQRILMYPLVVIFFVGVLNLDKGVVKYSLPLSLIGWLISFYHNLLHFGIIPESATPCAQGVSCSTKYIQWFGFITIPLLSFIGFTLIIALTFILKRKLENEK